MLSLWEVLKTSKGLPAPDGFTALFARSLSDTYTLAEISGIPPLNLGEIVEIADYTIEGNTYQSDGVSSDTPQEVVGCGDRTGNLLKLKDDYVANVRGVSVSIKNGTLTLKGIATGNGGRSTYLSESFMLQAGTYTLSSVEVPGLNYCLTNTADGSVIIAPKTATTFTLSEDTTVAFGVNVVQDTVYDTTVNIMLNSGSTPLPYEPYGYKVDVVTRGKNLIPYPYYNSNQTINGVTFTTENDGRIMANGAATGVVNFYLMRDQMLKAGTYTLSVIRNAPLANINLQMFDSSKGITFDGLITTIGGSTSESVAKTFTLNEDTNVHLLYAKSGLTETYIDEYVQLELGTEATSYEPYTPPITTPLYLDSPLYKIGDYTDRRGKTEEVRRIGIVDLGTLTYTKSSTSGNFTSVEVLPNARKISNTDTGNAICSAFKEVQANQVTDIPYSFSSTLNSSSIVYINGTGFEDMTAEDFKTAMNGVYVYYVLAEPEVTSVEPVEIPTLDGTTVIDVDTEVKPSNLKITYKSKM